MAVIALMGGLGVTGLELLLYPHWVREKGYPRFLGPPASAGWEGSRQRLGADAQG